MLIKGSQVTDRIMQCVYQHPETQRRHMVTYILVNINSNNGVFPDGTKPLPEPMLTNHR